MGVKLTSIVETSKKVITLENLRGKTIVLDAFNVIYQFLASIRGIDGQPLKDFKNRVTSHLSGILYRTSNLMLSGVKVAYVFDGKPNPLKAEEIQRRKSVKANAQKKMEDAQDDNDDKDTKKYAKGTGKLTSDMIEESKLLLSYLGVPCISAIEDGEAQASYMIQKDHAWGVGSQDYDVFLFGGQRIVRNLSVGQSRKVYGKTIVNQIEFYSLPKVLEELKITREQLVDIGILVGVDFFSGIRGIGDKLAYKYIQEYGSLDKLIHAEEMKTKYDLSPLTTEFIQDVRNIFLKPKTTDDYALKWAKPNLDKIRELLVEEHNFSKDRVDSVIVKLQEKNSTQSQTTIDTFFMMKK